jgi:Armadillo/beta-catenin-like repeat
MECVVEMRRYPPCRTDLAPICASCIPESVLTPDSEFPHADGRSLTINGPIVAAGALPVLVKVLGSTTSEATRESCAVAIHNISIGGALC